MCNFTLTIRTLGPDDVAAFRELRLLCLQESPTAFGSSVSDELSLSQETVMGRLQNHEAEGTFVLGAFVEESLVGIMGLMRHPRAKFYHKADLWGVYVHPEWRGQGIAGQLLDGVLSRAHQTTLHHIVLTVTCGNSVARSLYLSRGFVSCGFEKDALCWEGAYFDMETMQLRLVGNSL